MNRIGISATPASLTAALALAAVAGVTGFISYTHICALTLALHQSWKTAHLMPVAVDGQIVVGSVVLLAGHGRTARWGWLPIGFGLAESLFANWESGIAHGYLPAAAAMVAAQSFAASSFVFERWLKSHITAGGQLAGAGRPTTEQALGALLSTGSRRAVAAVLGVEAGQVQRWERQLAAAVEEEAANAA